MAAPVDLPLVCEAFSRGLQEGTKAIVHCCICGAGTQWNASSMVFVFVVCTLCAFFAAQNVLCVVCE